MAAGRPSARDRILEHLAARGPSTPSTIAAALGLTKHTVYSALSQMQDVRNTNGLRWVIEHPPYQVAIGPFDRDQDRLDEMWECYAPRL